MATLTINFTTSANAIKYRIKVRQSGTSTYAVHEVTSSPLVLNNIPCGIAYEGTVQAICSEGIPCDRYKVSTTSITADGDVHYDDCATGNSASQAITSVGSFYVCSRTTPIVQGSSSTTVTKVSQGECTSPSPEEISAPVYWSATAATCPADSYVFTSCADGTTEKYVSKVIWNSSNVYGSAPTTNLVYGIDFDGNGYTCWTYTREDDSTQHPSGLTIPLDVDQAVYDNCTQCEGTGGSDPVDPPVVTNYTVVDCTDITNGYIASYSGGTLTVGQAVKLSVDAGAGCYQVTGTTTNTSNATVLSTFADCNSCAS
jgi:hypothetical protein